MVGAGAAVWYVFFNLTSQSFLFDSLTALGIVIAFYYSLTGFACAIYHRKELTKSAKNFFFIGVAPVVGATILGGLFFKAIWEFKAVEDSYSGTEVFGAGIPMVLGVGLILLGIVLMLVVAVHRPRRLLRAQARDRRSGCRRGAQGRRRRRAGGERLMAAIVCGYDDSSGCEGRARGGGGARIQDSGDTLVIGYGYGAARQRGRRGAGASRGAAGARPEDDRRGEGPGRRRRRGRPGRAGGGARRRTRCSRWPERTTRAFIVVGTYGESPLKGAILGSTPHKLLHLSEVPVVVVPAA